MSALISPPSLKSLSLQDLMEENYVYVIYQELAEESVILAPLSPSGILESWNRVSTLRRPEHSEKGEGLTSKTHLAAEL